MKPWGEVDAQNVELGEDGGRWVLMTPDLCVLRVIASNGLGWDHVSVSLPYRTPTWAEMELVKRAFFRDHETALQYHVPSADHINYHPYCLHLWRPHHAAIPRPPAKLVGPATGGEAP
jgi:hypothetical protein